MAAREIYNCIPDSDKDFREFFTKVSTKLPPPRVMPRVLGHQYNDQLEEGGVLAVDMVAALCAEYTARIGQMKLKAQRRHHLNENGVPRISKRQSAVQGILRATSEMGE